MLFLNWVENKNCSSILKRAFTLAEVLIVLGVIGIVAELTIPTLMNNVQSQVLKNTWKKEYSTMAQATLQFANDSSGDLSNNFSLAGLADTYAKYLSVIKNCPVGQASNCWAYPSIGSQYTNSPSLILSDGAMILFNDDYSVNCAETALGPTLCFNFAVDVNGFKRPNLPNQDIFGAGVTKTGRLIPYGSSQYTYASYAQAGPFNNSFNYLYNN